MNMIIEVTKVTIKVTPYQIGPNYIKDMKYHKLTHWPGLAPRDMGFINYFNN